MKREDEYLERFLRHETIAQVAEHMGVTREAARYARRRLRPPTRGVVGRRGGARNRSQIKRERP